ncbi:molybdenum cofactor guanylyltransferase [Devosia aurantiaca]|uniref:Molybdenum cofactor guanylyltransferase n=1 Tax=Devosia aurantiaca TaxID=2714858 RepID=A0A6M1SR78_9HYPH|nr:molybdenum cofactor guanylyltransferase [Devosia aurantiaca]NGP19144.1 molybdenum cofactor guanylyltransferase [Devosia aurantiaca]
MTVFAVVLAGGQGSRLGDVRKAELRLGGQRLLDRVVTRLTGEILVSAGRGPQYAGYTCVPDLPGLVGGPLAGLAAAVLHLRGTAKPGDTLVSVPVDTPFLPADFVLKLAAGVTSESAAYAAWGEEIYPTNAAYRFGAISDLPERADSLGSPKRLLSALDAKAVRWEINHNPFANLNTLADLVSLARRVE